MKITNLQKNGKIKMTDVLVLSYIKSIDKIPYKNAKHDLKHQGFTQIYHSILFMKKLQFGHNILGHKIPENCIIWIVFFES